MAKKKQKKKPDNSNDDYWLLYSGISLAGMMAENNTPIIFKGPETMADSEAYHSAVEEVESYAGLYGIPDEPSEEEYEELADYYVEIINQKALDNFGFSEQDIIAETLINKDDAETIFKKYKLFGR